MEDIRVGSLSREDALEKEMATHFRILAWEIPWAVHGVPKSWHSWAHTRTLFNVKIRFPRKQMSGVFAVIRACSWTPVTAKSHLNYMKRFSHQFREISRKSLCNSNNYCERAEDEMRSCLQSASGLQIVSEQGEQGVGGGHRRWWVCRRPHGDHCGRRPPAVPRLPPPFWARRERLIPGPGPVVTSQVLQVPDTAAFPEWPIKTSEAAGARCRQHTRTACEAAIFSRCDALHPGHRDSSV